jgi:ankyrin repeat protein
MAQPLQVMISERCDKNKPDSDGESPLHVAALAGHLNVFLFLIGAGCNKNQGNKHGESPLHVACKAGQLDVARYLVEAGADKNKRTPTTLCTPIYIASQHGHLPLVQYLIQAEADINIGNNHGETALIIASVQGQIGVVCALIEAKANLEAYTKKKQSALWLAAEAGHLDVVEALCINGANVNHVAGTVHVFRQKFALEDAIGSHACSLEANMRVTNGIPLGGPLLLPVDTVNCVQTLKARNRSQRCTLLRPKGTLMW